MVVVVFVAMFFVAFLAPLMSLLVPGGFDVRIASKFTPEASGNGRRSDQ
jgi:hypothetical protein